MMWGESLYRVSAPAPRSRPSVDAKHLAQLGDGLRAPPLGWRTCRATSRAPGSAPPPPSPVSPDDMVGGSQRLFKGAGAGAPPHRFICPITMEVMADPHMTRAGINYSPILAQTQFSDSLLYEKAAIDGWLRHNKCDPSTREAMTERDLFPNRALREEIAEWKRRNIALAPPAARTA
eukprot:gene33366-biopygen28747